MLKLLVGFLKYTVFALVIIILANWFKWDGKTISDQVKVQMSQAQKKGWVKNAKEWAENQADQISESDQVDLKEFLKKQSQD